MHFNAAVRLQEQFRLHPFLEPHFIRSLQRFVTSGIVVHSGFQVSLKVTIPIPKDRATVDGQSMLAPSNNQPDKQPA